MSKQHGIPDKIATGSSWATAFDRTYAEFIQVADASDIPPRPVVELALFAFVTHARALSITYAQHRGVTDLHNALDTIQCQIAEATTYWSSPAALQSITLEDIQMRLSTLPQSVRDELVAVFVTPREEGGAGGAEENIHPFSCSDSSSDSSDSSDSGPSEDIEQIMGPQFAQVIPQMDALLDWRQSTCTCETCAHINEKAALFNAWTPRTFPEFLTKKVLTDVIMVIEFVMISFLKWRQSHPP